MDAERPFKSILTRPAAAHWRQHKALVVQLKGLSWFFATQKESVFIFDEPL